MERMKMEPVNMTEQNIERIGALFPNCITEMLDEEKSTSDNKVYKKIQAKYSEFRTSCTQGVTGKESSLAGTKSL